MFDQKKLQRYYDMKRAGNLLGLQMLMARRMWKRVAVCDGKRLRLGLSRK